MWQHNPTLCPLPQKILSDTARHSDHRTCYGLSEQPGRRKQTVGNFAENHDLFLRRFVLPWRRACRVLISNRAKDRATRRRSRGCAPIRNSNGMNIVSAYAEKSLRIILADDHPIFLIGLRVVLEQNNCAKVIAQASNPDELLEILRRVEADVLVTDFMMPDEHHNDGLRLLHRIRRDFPELPIIVVTMLNNAALFRAILELKIQGVLSKASVAGELPAAIASVRRKHLYIADSVRQIMLDAADHDLNGTVKPLSSREIEVIRLLATGMTIGEIAVQLNRSKQTVSAQKINAMRKLGLASEAALFIYLQENGLG